MVDWAGGRAGSFMNTENMIDGLFGYRVVNYANIVKLILKIIIKPRFIVEKNQHWTNHTNQNLKKCKKLVYIELYFMNNHQNIELFVMALQDARLFSDGYDFQIATTQTIIWWSKGIRQNKENCLTEMSIYKSPVNISMIIFLTLVLNLKWSAKILVIENPVNELHFKEVISQSL